MKKLLLLLPLILATPVLAESDSVGLGKPPNEKFFSHLKSAQDLKNLKDYKGACREMGLAIQILKTKFIEIQQADPEKNWPAIKNELQTVFGAAGCGDDNHQSSRSDGYVSRMEKARDLLALGDTENWCRELAFAFTYLKYNFDDMQQERPDIDVFEVMEDHASLLSDACLKDKD